MLGGALELAGVLGGALELALQLAVAVELALPEALEIAGALDAGPGGLELVCALATGTAAGLPPPGGTLDIDSATLDQISVGK